MRRKALLKISRPRFWIYLLGPFFLGLAANGFLQSFPIIITQVDVPTLILSLSPILVFGLYFTLPANLLIYGINDIFDYQTDAQNVKKQGYESLLKPSNRRALWTAIFVTNLPFLVPFSIAAILWPYSSIAILSFLFFGIFYSAPPIRAKARPFLDSLFNVLYLLPGVFGFLIYTSDVTLHLPLLIAASLWCMAMHAYSAVPDIQADRGAHIRTIATTLGRNRTLWFCLIFYAVAAALSFQILGVLSLILGLVYTGLMTLSLRANSDQMLFKYYGWFPRINTIAGFALFIFTFAYSR